MGRVAARVQGKATAPVSYPLIVMPLDDKVLMTPERLLSIILAIGFLAAPPLALLYGLSPGLVVLAGALVATIGLAWSARAHLPEAAQARLRLMLSLNALLLIATIVALVLVNQ